MAMKLSYPAGSRGRFDWWGIAGLVVFAAVVVGLVSFRMPMISLQPGLAGLYRNLGLSTNVRGLALENFSVLQDVSNGAPGMVVEGEIRNLTRNRVMIPPLRLALLGADGQELSSWSAEAGPAELAAGDKTRFRTRVPSAPDGSRSITVRFGNGPAAEGSR